MSIRPLDAKVSRVYAQIEAELGFGMVPNVFRAMAQVPDFLEANWCLFRSVVLQGRLPRVVKEMIGIVVSVVHDSHYARDVHMHSLAVQGMDKQLLAALGRGEQLREGMAPAHLAVLEFAHAAAIAPTAIPASARANLVECGLDAEECFEVIAAVQLFTAINTFTDTARVALDVL